MNDKTKLSEYIQSTIDVWSLQGPNTQHVAGLREWKAMAEALEQHPVGAEPPQPVAWMLKREDPLAPSLFTKWEVMRRIELRRNKEKEFTPLYAHPPALASQPALVLTDEWVKNRAMEIFPPDEVNDGCPWYGHRRALEDHAARQMVRHLHKSGYLYLSPPAEAAGRAGDLGDAAEDSGPRVAPVPSETDQPPSSAAATPAIATLAPTEEEALRMVNWFRWAHEFSQDLAISQHGPMPPGYEDNDEPDTPWHCCYDGFMQAFHELWPLIKKHGIPVPETTSPPDREGNTTKP